jgi:3-phenylpropionate/cinnamic acid dioxygenase small subunit
METDQTGCATPPSEQGGLISVRNYMGQQINTITVKHNYVVNVQLDAALTTCFSSKFKIGYMFQPPRWSSSGLITDVIGRNFCH